MHLLLDTHALIWWMTENPSLPVSVRRLMVDKRNTVLVSAASAWEMATKVRLGRLPA
ncbi:MAG: type II toxin-antitoxin system VapC family toxin, partial [Terriglobales bacterium]